MYLDDDIRHRLYDALLQEKFAIQALMLFFQNEIDINKEDIEEYLRLEDSIINVLRNVSDILKDRFSKA